MKTYLDCMHCSVRQALEAARAVSDDAGVHEEVLREVLRIASDFDLSKPPPLVAQLVHRRLRELTGAEDPYRRAKSHANRLAMEALPVLSARVHRSDDPLLEAARCAVAANAIDMGSASKLTEEDIRTALQGLGDEPVHGDWEAFLDAVAGAKDILYLADNAGEIAVDRLAVEALGPERVTVVVRGAPVINDATLEDALEVRMHELVPVIENGSDAPGTVLEDCSAELRRRFERADLVVAKGQGNFETLSDSGEKVAFWFKVKCPSVSGHVGLPIGSHALLPPGHVGRMPPCAGVGSC